MNLQNLNKERMLISEVLKSKKKNVCVAGWVNKTRTLGKIRFLVLRDISGIIQVTAVKGQTSDDVFEIIDSITRESVVYVQGEIKESKQAPGGKEIIPEKIDVLAMAEELPIDVSENSKTELPKRLDYRFLDLHRRKTQAIFKIQSTISIAFKEYFTNKGFIDIHPPSLIGSSSEGGTDLFEAKYFEKKAYLAQSPQLYKQMLACSVEKVITITPVWRAEKHNTIRHLNECRQMDIEMAFADAKVVMKEMERVVKYIVEEVIKKNKEELDLIEVKLKIPKAEYMTFKETNELLKKHRVETNEKDLTGEGEKKLGEIFPDTIIFVYDWPMDGKPFYIMPKNEKVDSKLSEGFDAIYKGMEISSGGQRIHIPDLLIKRLKAKGLNPKDFKNYIDSFKYGAPPHAGWSIGIERFTHALLELPNVREACLFPRDRDRLTP